MENEVEENEEPARNNNDKFNNEDQIVYQGAPLIVAHSMLLILTLLIHHNIDICLSDIKVINLHCLPEQLKKIAYINFENTSLLKKQICRNIIVCFAREISNQQKIFVPRVPERIIHISSNCHFLNSCGK